MAYSVLILDDDADFNSLLTDIFEQADYIVTSLQDPVQAVEVFRNAEFDLVVTDHKMPVMTGAEFMGVIKEISAEVPVIMVSGYLENETIRELIGGGVGGVFLKPLNIFWLLERTAELVEEARKLKQTSGAEVEDVSAEAGPSALGFAFRSFPCKSQASVEFAQRLHNLRNFKSTLSLIGEQGSHYRAICEDIHGFYENDKEQFVYLSPGSFDSEQVFCMLKKAKLSGAERVTCVLLEIELMSDEQKTMACALAKREGLFEALDVDVRTIFCISGDLDCLFDEGLIDEHLYILMGTGEVRVPALRDCPVDIALMAEQLVAEIIKKRGQSTVSRFEKSAKDLLRKHPWVNNYAELRATVRKVMETSSDDVLTLAVLMAAVQSREAVTPRAQLEAHLSSARVDYVRAASILFGTERAKVASFFGVDASAIEATLQ
jgi:two-component system NtrC family response regulator